MKRCSSVVVGQTAARNPGGLSSHQGGGSPAVASAALNRPANLKLSGAWAFYETRHQEDNDRILALEKQVSELSSSNNSFQRKLAEALAQLSAETTQREALRSQAEGSEQQLRQLDERYRSLHEISGRERIMLQKEAERLREENEELQREGTATREDARNRNSEIMTLREDLRVSKESERQLAERVEIAEVSAAEHAERSGELERENLALIQQRDHHLHHAELLMKEKNRYFTQLQELRKRQAEEAASGDASAARATYARSVRVSTAPSLQKEKTRQKDKREGAKSVSVCVQKASASFTKRDAIREAQNRRRGRVSTLPLP